MSESGRRPVFGSKCRRRQGAARPLDKPLLKPVGISPAGTLRSSGVRGCICRTTEKTVPGMPALTLTVVPGRHGIAPVMRTSRRTPACISPRGMSFAVDLPGEMTTGNPDLRTGRGRPGITDRQAGRGNSTRIRDRPLAGGIFREAWVMLPARRNSAPESPGVTWWSAQFAAASAPGIYRRRQGRPSQVWRHQSRRILRILCGHR
jgi:hypothetical protein